MTTFRTRHPLLLAMATITLTAVPAMAQPEVPDSGGRVYGLVGGGFGDGRFVATGAGAGLRLTRHLGLDVELTHLSSNNNDETSRPWLGGTSVFSSNSTTGAAAVGYPLVGAGDDYLFPSIRYENHGRDVTTFLTKFTVEFPVADGLLFPYFTGGGGVGRVTERASVVIDSVPLISWDNNQTAAVMRFSGAGFFPEPTVYSELGLALVLGGGVDVRLWRGLGVGVDIRWLRILRDYGAFDTAQVTSRASYRF